MINKTVPLRLSAIAGTNFLSVFNLFFFCAYATLRIYHNQPLFEQQAMNMLFVAGLFALPLLFTGLPAQFLNTRFSTRNVIVFAKAAEILLMLAGMIALAGMKSAGVMPVLTAIVLLGVDYSIYRPALKTYSASALPKAMLSWTSGVTESATFFGIVVGTVCAVVAYNVVAICGVNPELPGLFAVLCAAAATLTAAKIDPNLPQQRLVRFAELPIQWLDTLRRQPRYRELVLTGMGESYIFGSIIFITAMAIQYLEQQFAPDMNTQLKQYSIMAAPIIGGGVGCIVSGWRSKHNVEIGLVPPAVTAMTIAALLIGTLPLYSDVFIESGLLALLLFIFGFFAGVMVVPMQAYQEYFVRRELRSAFFSWFYFPFGLGILLAITLSALMYHYQVAIFPVTLALALVSAALAGITFFFMPQFLLRMLMRMLLRSLYRLRTYNAERIPEEGPALLVANRASFVDMLFISACTTRPIRFMMHESYYRYPLLYPLYRSVGFIEVTNGKPKRLRQLFQTTRDLLRKGEIICVFPEGDITRNGIMSGFSNGLTEMIPDDVPVPVIPVRIGMTWGSIFSCYYGKFKLRWPNELPHPASVTVGNPIPRNTSAYEIRIILSELAAETELVPTAEERPFHSQLAFICKRKPLGRCLQEYDGGNWRKPANFSVLLRAILISRHLRRLAAADEEYIGLMLPNGVLSTTVLTAVMMAGRCPAVMNYTASREANRHAIKQAGIRHIVTSRAFLEKVNVEIMPEMVFIEDAAPHIAPFFRRLTWTLGCLLLSSRELMKLVSPENWNDVNCNAALIFSSGSTGLPKGVMLTHHNINADVASELTNIGWTKQDIIIGNLPIFHSFGLNVCMWLPLMTGARVVMIPNALDGHAAGTVLREAKVTVMAATPGFLQLYMRRCDKNDFRSLRLVITGAEKLRDDVADRFYALTGLRIAEGYGCTELSPIVSINLANSRMEMGVEVAERGSIGPPITGVCVKIVDPSTFELLPEDTDGLLIVKGAIVMRGYLNEPEKTREVIRDGWYVTGDIAHMNRNGFITITGRLSRFSKIAGEMVPHELVEREINNILLPDDRLVAVCGGEDPRRGEKLVVFYTDPERLDPDDLVRQLRKRGIPNLWIPKVENFVRVEHLPLLGSGKLDLSYLVRMAENFCKTGRTTGE